jgi:hypothetical protein
MRIQFVNVDGFNNIKIGMISNNHADIIRKIAGPPYDICMFRLLHRMCGAVLALIGVQDKIKDGQERPRRPSNDSRPGRACGFGLDQGLEQVHVLTNSESLSTIKFTATAGSCSS